MIKLIIKHNIDFSNCFYSRRQDKYDIEDVDVVRKISDVLQFSIRIIDQDPKV